MRGDVTIDIPSSPIGAGFKFNTLPQGGMTIEAGHAVRVQSFSEIQLVPADGKAVLLQTTGGLPSPSAALRGALFVLRGNPDTLQVCLKDSTTGYSWKVIATG